MDNLYPAMESERDLPVSEQKAREMGCIDTVERKIVQDLREKLQNESAVSIYDYGFDWKHDGIDISREDLSMKRICSRLFTVILSLPCMR